MRNCKYGHTNVCGMVNATAKALGGHAYGHCVVCKPPCCMQIICMQANFSVYHKQVVYDILPSINSGCISFCMYAGDVDGACLVCSVQSDAGSSDV